MKIRNLTKSLLFALTLLIFNPSYAELPSALSININNATAEQLETIKGIGSKKAQAIIEYRTEHGNFTSVEDLTSVKGIGNKFIEKNKTLLSTE